MIILWTILSIIGLIVTVWYFTSVLNPYGRINYPMLLWKSTGHIFSWILIIIGFISLIMLYRSIQDSTSFLKIIGGILIVLLFVKNKLTPMRMPFNDVMGSLYSGEGLRFGGFQTFDFLGATEPLKEKRPYVREEIVAEAHYLAYWLHTFPEMGFFLGTIFSKSLFIGFSCFVIAYLLEILRFYTFGASPLVSSLCRFWNWLKCPLFIGASIFLWSEGKLIPIIFLIFLILQGKFIIISAVAMLPIKLFIGYWLFKKYGDPHINNMEGLAMNFVINRWRLKLFPADKFNVGQ